MQISDKDDRVMHSRLPIGSDEKVLAIYKHHWFAYASLWFTSIFIVLAIMGIAAFLTFVQGSSSSDVSSHKALVFEVAGVFSVLVLLFTLVPVYLRSQEQVVLTEEALLQILQPTIFASKISQLNLQHIADVSVRQDFLGTICGFGKISVETPGEQDNYEFVMLPKPQATAREIISAHENYQAALQAGRMPTTLGTAQPSIAAPAIDPQQYQQFLQYQQMLAQQQASQSASPASPQDTSAPADPQQVPPEATQQPQSPVETTPRPADPTQQQ